MWIIALVPLTLWAQPAGVTSRQSKGEKRKLRWHLFPQLPPLPCCSAAVAPLP